MEISSTVISANTNDKVKLCNDRINGLFINVRSLKAINKFDKIKELLDLYEHINILWQKLGYMTYNSLIYQATPLTISTDQTQEAVGSAATLVIKSCV